MRADQSPLRSVTWPCEVCEVCHVLRLFYAVRWSPSSGAECTRAYCISCGHAVSLPANERFDPDPAPTPAPTAAADLRLVQREYDLGDRWWHVHSCGMWPHAHCVRCKRRSSWHTVISLDGGRSDDIDPDHLFLFCDVCSYGHRLFAPGGAPASMSATAAALEAAASVDSNLNDASGWDFV